MGRTYRNSDKEREGKIPTSVKKKKKEDKPLLNKVYSEEAYYEELDMEAYDEEYSEKIRRKRSR